MIHSFRLVVFISCIVAAHSSPISNRFASGKLQYRPPYPAVKEQLLLLNRQISVQESKIEKLESEIANVEELLKSGTSADQNYLRSKDSGSSRSETRSSSSATRNSSSATRSSCSLFTFANETPQQ